MADKLTMVVAVVVGLGGMILVHEWGHFIVARLFKVRVDTFAIGFGPRLWGRKRGPTDYRINALPIGGYVRMAGDNPAEDRAGSPDEFLSKPRWQRALIALAGPTMNLIAAFVLSLTVFLILGLEVPTYYTQPAQPMAFPRNSLAEKAGMQPGDRISAVNGQATPSWEAVYTVLQNVPPGSDVALTVERSGEKREISIPSANPREADRILGYPTIPPVLEQISAGLPAERAGLKPGDEVVELDGHKILTWLQLFEDIRQSEGKPLSLTIQRGDGPPLHLQVKPIRGRTPEGETVWQVGIRPRNEVILRRANPVQAFSDAVTLSASEVKQVVGVLGQLITLRVHLRDLQSIVGISRAAGEAARRGIRPFLELIAFISINLAVLNLLPIPILDGGHIFMLGIEGAMGRDISLKVKERVVTAAFVFLVLIIAVVMYYDVRRLIPSP